MASISAGLVARVGTWPEPSTRSDAKPIAI